MPIELIIDHSEHKRNVLLSIQQVLKAIDLDDLKQIEGFLSLIGSRKILEIEEVYEQ